MRPVIQALITAGADLKTGTPNGTTPLMVAAAAGEVAAVKVLIENGADVNAKDGVRAQTPLMYAAASNRAAVIELLAANGADLKATSKVSNLANLSREGLGFGGNPQVPGGGAAPRRRARRAPMPGVDRNYSLNELIVAHGGLTPLLYAVRQGFHESTVALLKAGADVNLVVGRRPHHAAADGDHQRPLRSREDAARSRRRPERDQRTGRVRRSTACSTSSGRRRRSTRSRGRTCSRSSATSS